MSKGRRFTPGPLSSPQKIPNEPVFSDHHIIPRSKGGADTKLNILRIFHPYHKEIHDLFVNKLPHEQMEILFRLSYKTLSEEFRARIEYALECEEKYNPEAFR